MRHTFDVYDYGREVRFSCGARIHFTRNRSMLKHIVCPQHVVVAEYEPAHVERWGDDV